MIRKAKAMWRGTGRDGTGNLSTDSGVLASTPYSFKTRFETEKGTNPEELIAAAHAGCFTMALTAQLSRAQTPPARIHTDARVTLAKVGDAFAITRIELATEAQVPGIDDAAFQKLAQDAKQNCPVSKALAGTDIHLKAKLIT